MDRFDALAAFVKVADLKGFAAASRVLGISPSAATRLVAGLEERLGARLLHRTTRSVVPTDAGRRYLERARAILAELAEADEVARAERTTPSGRLTVGAPLMFGRLHVAPLMSGFLARHADVAGSLQLADRLVSMVDEGIDLAIRIGHLPDSGAIVRRVGRTRRVVAASPGYLARMGQPRRPEDVQRHTTIDFSGLAGAVDWPFADGGRDIRIPVAPRFSTNSADAAIAHAETDGGLVSVLSYQAAEAVRAGRLEVVLKRYERPTLPIQVVYPAARMLPLKVRAFVDMIEADADWDFARL
jgi:DNA-binding transcriptional LysR family regulator